MKTLRISLLLVCVLAVYDASSQWYNGTVIKTRPSALIFLNPSLEIEKFVSPQFSLVLDLTQINTRVSNIFSDDFLKPSIGFRGGFGLRFYPKPKELYGGWYMGLLVRSSKENVRGLERVNTSNGFTGPVFTAAELDSRSNSRYLLGGYQALLKRVVLDISFGFGAREQRDVYLDAGSGEVISRENENVFSVYSSFSIGIVLGKLADKKAVSSEVAP
ncbi:MAG TPA: hypothetical protein VFV37_06180 [Luteibaculaceae bacterium]|nr:hypothetical protein [Luteibaculaceae bacterium]